MTNSTLPSIGVGIFGAVVVVSIVAGVGMLLAETKGKNYEPPKGRGR